MTRGEMSDREEGEDEDEQVEERVDGNRKGRGADKKATVIQAKKAP
jgi:hypothetical protein